MPSSPPLVHLHPIPVVELGGTSKVPESVRDRLSLTREGKLWWRVCLHHHLEQGGMPGLNMRQGERGSTKQPSSLLEAKQFL